MRKQHGLSARDLATAAGVDPARVAALEDGQLDPDFELLIALAKRMGDGPAALFLQAEELARQDAEGATGRE
jgi:transcriptional regulator with XRE-family HTH domain